MFEELIARDRETADAAIKAIEDSFREAVQVRAAASSVGKRRTCNRENA